MNLTIEATKVKTCGLQLKLHQLNDVRVGVRREGVCMRICNYTLLQPFTCSPSVPLSPLPLEHCPNVQPDAP